MYVNHLDYFVLTLFKEIFNLRVPGLVRLSNQLCGRQDMRQDEMLVKNIDFEVRKI